MQEQQTNTAAEIEAYLMAQSKTWTTSLWSLVKSSLN